MIATALNHSIHGIQGHRNVRDNYGGAPLRWATLGYAGPCRGECQAWPCWLPSLAKWKQNTALTQLHCQGTLSTRPLFRLIVIKIFCYLNMASSSALIGTSPHKEKKKKNLDIHNRRGAFVCATLCNNHRLAQLFFVRQHVVAWSDCYEQQLSHRLLNN